jgi:hypothetical protein
MQCSGCNEEVTAGESQCPKCGIAVAQESDSADSQPQKEADAAAGDSSTAEPPRVHVEVKDSQFRDLYNIVLQHVADNGKAEPAELSLLDYLSELPDHLPTDPGIRTFLQEELVPHAESLRANRVLVVSCNDPALSRAAVAALLETMSVPGRSRKVLDFDALPAGITPSVSQLLTPSVKVESELVVVADAAGADRAQAFVDSLFSFGGYFTSRVRIQKASDAGVWLICLTEPQQIARILSRNVELPFHCWSISQLDYILRQQFPDSHAELRRTIERQRAAGGWNKDSGDFERQLTSLSKTDLIDAVSRGGVNATATLVDEIPDPEHPLHLAVLYTATFYPNLSPGDFRNVVTKLIEGERMLVPEVVHHETKDGTLQPVEMKRERELAQIWRERSDRMLRECRIITSRDAGVTFSDTGRRDRLRSVFEESYGLYVQSRFAAAVEKNFLFGSSKQVATNVVALSVGMARNYPDEIGVDWLYELVLRACSGSPGKPGNADVYQRIFELLRAMLDDAKLEANVAGVLRRLLAEGQHEIAFNILKKLRYTPVFDVFHWLRQAADQGSDEIRAKIYPYLFNDLKKPGHVYPLLYALEPWLPQTERDPQTYSPSNRTALRLMLEYCTEATIHFDMQQYGKWPSRFPLLAVDADVAPPHFALLVRWLLHPGMAAVFGQELSGEQLDRLVPSLLAEWAFILLGCPNTADDTTAAPRSEGSESWSASAAFELLLKRIVEGTSVPQQRARQQRMLTYWENVRRALTGIALLAGDGRQRRRELGWKREVLRKLITDFRRIQRELRPPPVLHHATA